MVFLLEFILCAEGPFNCGHSSLCIAVFGFPSEFTIESILINFFPSEYCCIVNFEKYLIKPYGYNVTSQSQEPKDLIRPATAKIVYTILYSPEASLLQA